MLAGEHQKRFENTESLIKENIFEIDSTNHFDWLAVIMYYGAMHIIERRFALRSVPHHSQSHKERNREARTLKVGYQITSDIMLLYDAGLNARYNNTFLTKEEIKILKESYDRIKAILYP